MSIAIEAEGRMRFRNPKRGDPVWELAYEHPLQGEWTEAKFLALADERRVEYCDGFLEFLPMASPLHQRLAQFLYEALKAFVVAQALGEVFIAPLPIRLRAGKYRDPDVVFLRPGRVRDPRKSPEGADLAMEVVSGDEEDRERDYVTKREEYANAGIPEYWIVDPDEKRVTVLVLAEGSYREHGVFEAGQTAASRLLPGFAVDVAALFAASGVE